MTFCSNEQKRSEIITKVEANNGWYTIHYLDGNKSTFCNSDKDFMKKLEEKLINQAITRDKMNCDNIEMDKWFSIMGIIIGFNFTNACLKRNLLMLTWIGIFTSILSISNCIKHSKKINELKKYKIFLENYEEFKNNPNITKYIDFDPIYREPLDIFNLDKYSLNDIRIMQKQLKNKEC